MKKRWKKPFQVIEFMMLSSIKTKVKNYIVRNLGGSEDDFIIDEVFIFFKNSTILFVVLPKKFKLNIELGIDYFYINESVLYDFKEDAFSLVDPISFLSNEDIHLEYLKAINLKRDYSYEDILNYLNRRGFLIFNDFERLLINLGINSDNLIFSFLDRQMEEILIEGLNNNQVEKIINFLNDIKADFKFVNNSIVVRKNLLNSDSFYDEKKGLIVNRKIGH